LALQSTANKHSDRAHMALMAQLWISGRISGLWTRQASDEAASPPAGSYVRSEPYSILRGCARLQRATGVEPSSERGTLAGDVSLSRAPLA
jgi:hypothetical protein